MEPADQSTTDQQTAELTKKVRQLIKASGKRQTAGAELVALGDEAMTILCSLAAAEGVRARRLRWAAYYSVLLNCLLRIMVPAGRPFVLLMIVSGVGAIISMFLTPLRWRATRLLSSLDDVRLIDDGRLIGSLLDAITVDFRDSTLRESLRQSLTRLLPRLQASDAARLLPRHITTLNNEVNHSFISRWESGVKVDYLLVVLKALEQVGDETSLPTVEKLFETTDNDRVLKAAEACLPFLQQRAVLGKHTLLRAASHSAADLLLPAHGAAEPAPDMLLRAVSEGNLAERP